MSLPFDQQPAEGPKSFAAFTTYLALGPGRSLSKAAAAIGRTKDQLAHWSQRWHWRSRAAAYDAHLARVHRESTETILRQKSHDWAQLHHQVRTQAWREAEDLLALAQDLKTRWRDSDRLPTFESLLRALDTAFRLKQFAAGMPSEIKEVNTTLTGPEGGPVRLQLEAALKKIYGQPIPGEVLEVQAVAQTSNSPVSPTCSRQPPDPQSVPCPPQTQ